MAKIHGFDNGVPQTEVTGPHGCKTETSFRSLSSFVSNTAVRNGRLHRWQGLQYSIVKPDRGLGLSVADIFSTAHHLAFVVILLF